MLSVFTPDHNQGLHNNMHFADQPEDSLLQSQHEPRLFPSEVGQFYNSDVWRFPVSVSTQYIIIALQDLDLNVSSVKQTT
jgi:hypothetical protein